MQSCSEKQVHDVRQLAPLLQEFGRQLEAQQGGIRDEETSKAVLLLNGLRRDALLAASSAAARTALLPCRPSHALRNELLRAEAEEEKAKDNLAAGGPAAAAGDGDGDDESDGAEEPPQPDAAAWAAAAAALRAVPSKRKRAEEDGEAEGGRAPQNVRLMCAMDGTLEVWEWRYAGEELEGGRAWAPLPKWVGDTLADGMAQYADFEQMCGVPDASLKDMARRFKALEQAIDAAGTGRAVCVPLPVLAEMEAMATQAAQGSGLDGDDGLRGTLTRFALHYDRVLLALRRVEGG
eukprot:Rhum_TRINITY_DN518_c0_g1::Rhum_TRINITY_DN518_c0_g1_i1::g.1662::m.1662